ncbi:MAG TPA: hypothetical protein VMV46_20115 [Thermoanaerobaculia bacterium]|nr:hypothetical protein [Thermoanaerobaculia bacterium]
MIRTTLPAPDARPSAPEAARDLAESAAPLVRELGVLALAAPIEPAVFFQEGLDWRWLDRGELASRVARSHALLIAGGPLEDVTVSYRSRPDPATLILDLALQHAGALPRPQALAGAPAPGGAWIDDPRDPRLEGLEAAEPGSVERWRARAELEVAALAAGCSRPLPGRSRWARRWGLAEPREVVIDVLELERPLCRSGVAWTLRRGGALVLAHERSSLTASMRWARPTRLWAGTAEAHFDDLVAAVLQGRAGRSSRLLSAVWCGREPPGAGALAALAGAGVEVAGWLPP